MINDFFQDRLLLSQFSLEDIVEINGPQHKWDQHGYGKVIDINKESCSLKIRWQKCGEKWYSPRTVKKSDKTNISFVKKSYHRFY